MLNGLSVPSFLNWINNILLSKICVIVNSDYMNKLSEKQLDKFVWHNFFFIFSFKALLSFCQRKYCALFLCGVCSAPSLVCHSKLSQYYLLWKENGDDCMLLELRPFGVAGCVSASAITITHDATVGCSSINPSIIGCPVVLAKGLQYTVACGLQRWIWTTKSGKTTSRYSCGTIADDPSLLFSQNGKSAT